MILPARSMLLISITRTQFHLQVFSKKKNFFLFLSFSFLFSSLPKHFFVSTEPRTGTTALPLPSLVHFVVVVRQPPPSLSLLNVGRRSERTSPLRRHRLLGIRHVGGLAHSGHHRRVAVVAAGQQHLLGRVGVRVRIVDRSRKCERKRERERGVGRKRKWVRRAGFETAEASPSTFSFVFFVLSGFWIKKSCFLNRLGFWLLWRHESFCFCDVFLHEKPFSHF